MTENLVALQANIISLRNLPLEQSKTNIKLLNKPERLFLNKAQAEMRGSFATETWRPGVCAEITMRPEGPIHC